MTLFKIIKDSKVISVGYSFLKWNDFWHRLYSCDVNEAELVQSYDEKYIVKSDWLKPLPKEAGEYETAQVVVIDQTEYDDLYALLEDGKPIVEVIEQVQEEPVPEEPIEETKLPMSIAEMRELIEEQQKQIEMLIEKISK